MQQNPHDLYLLASHMCFPCSRIRFFSFGDVFPFGGLFWWFIEFSLEFSRWPLWTCWVRRRRWFFTNCQILARFQRLFQSFYEVNFAVTSVGLDIIHNPSCFSSPQLKHNECIWAWNVTLWLSPPDNERRRGLSVYQPFIISNNEKE